MNTNNISEKIKNYRTLMNKADVLGSFDEYLEENNIYEGCDSYDDIIHKIIELKDQKKTPAQILDAIIVFIDDEYEFHPDKDLEDEEMAEIWKEDMEELIQSILEN